jgi:putative endopeptidase
MKQLVGCLLAGLFTFGGLCVAQTSGASSGVDLKAIDSSVNPCQDFYQYACGNWMRSNPVPAEYGRWGRFNELTDRNLETLRTILDDASKHRKDSAIEQKIGDFYASCMDEPEIDKAGDKPLRDEIARIKAIPSAGQIAPEVARLHNEGVNVFFLFGSDPDPDNARLEIAHADQAGLGLPDRDFYIRTDAKSEETRKKYVEHIARVFELLGDNGDVAGVRARGVMTIEMNLAAASLSRVDRRNPTLLRHKMTATEFESLTPQFDFPQYLTLVQAPTFASMNVRVPGFYQNLGKVLQATALNELKSYMIWHYVHSYAADLSKPFVDEDFAFYGHDLTGAEQLEPRWKRCVESTDQNLPEALGQKYVDKAFAGQSKQKTRELVSIIEQQMETDIKSLTWMSDTTKQQALAKLKGVTNKIGYPERWRDYSSVAIAKNDFLSNVSRCREFEQRRDLDKIGKPVDRMEFHMSPPTVNAYYNPSENNINFPAGILQPPFYNNSADMAVNFGAIGSVIGHELTHGFDDQGRQFDADGNLRDWWTAQDAAEFKQRADCIANEYSQFSPVAGVNLNGRLTLGENGADNAGIRLAFMALAGALENGGVSTEKLDGFTPRQRFFLGYAQVWCQTVRPAEARNRALTDPHSPGRFRVDGVVENVPGFAQAFGCSAGQPMVAANACRVW